MKKILKLLAYSFFIIILFHLKGFAKNSFNTIVENNYEKIVSLGVAIVPPAVSTPIYLCQNSVASPLTATASTGCTLIWYGTSPTGGVGSSTAPTPLTTSVGPTTYYVSQTDGITESARVAIVVNVVADNGGTILGFTCDASQILLADKDKSVFFDWSNSSLIPNNLYSYTYSIEGGTPVSGTTGVSHQQVFGMLPGQSATLTLSATTYPCVPSKILTCTVPCGTSTITPNFPAITPFCSGTVAPLLGNVSPNGISGTWSPAIINNTTSGNYVFTPNHALFPCATTQTLSVTVIPLGIPIFTTIPVTVCQNATAPILPLSSSNSTPITGTWNPSTVNTAVLGPVIYTFTPNPGQCVAAVPPTSVIITVTPIITPAFTAVSAICSGTALAALPTTSNNGITGIWSPALNNTATTTYTFTPTVGQCATTTTMTITVTPKVPPTFTAIPAICAGDPLAPLPTNSTNGYAGSWFPGLDNTATTTYTFTPNTGQCATTAILTIMVNLLNTPVFTTVPAFVCENDIPLVLPTNSSDTPSITGTWSPDTVDTSVLGPSDYVFTPNPGQCAIAITQSVTVNPSNTLVDFTWTVTEAFSKNQGITVTASGTGDYLYQLDDGPFQQSPVFEYVAAGYHSVTVKDLTGCSSPITKTDILVIDFPRFFTPNNDGYNDAWNIFTLEDALGSKIQIFDRYGKLLKEISPNGSGWDGSYNGHPLPATDYWFLVDYAENGIVKQFKSHFSLKR